MSDNFKRETAGSKAGHSETGRSLSLSVELAEHFKQSGALANYFKEVRLINCMDL